MPLSGRTLMPMHRQATPGAALGKSPSHSVKEDPDSHIEVGAACRNRTDDLFITSESLYRLS